MSDIVVSNLPVLVDVASVGIQGAQGIQGALGPVGPVGPQGPQGLPGAAVGIGEAPTDGTIYGRKGNTATWLNVLGLATGGTVSAATTFSAGLTVAGGGSLAGTFSGTPTWSGAHTFNAAGTALVVTNAATVTGQMNVGSTISIGTTVAGGGNTTISTPNGSHININPQGSAHVKIGGGTGPLDFGFGGIQGGTVNAANLVAGAGTAFQQSIVVSGSKALASITGMNQLNVSSDVAALTGQPMFHTAINYNYGGGAYTGNRGGLLISMSQTGAAAGTSAAGGITALQATANTAASMGGTNNGTGAAGAIFAGNLYARIASGSTNIVSAAGLEIDGQADTGTTYRALAGLLVVATASHRQVGVQRSNTAITVAAQNGSIGWDIGYLTNSWALTSAGTMFLADFAQDQPVFSIGRGFDLRAVTFASDLFAASGFAVGPTGRVRVGTGYFDVTGTGAALSVDGAICTAGSLTGAVATTYPSDGNGYYVDDPYGGMWAVTFASGTSSITAIALVNAPVVKGAPPANPVTLTPRTRLNIFGPGTITANLTWDTSRTALAVQSLSSGKLGFFGSTPVVKPAGWGTSTGGARAAITGSSTLAQVAAGLSQLLTDLQTYGLLGT